MAGVFSHGGAPGEQVVESVVRPLPREVDRAEPVAGRKRTRRTEQLRCSFCQTELGEGLELTIPESGIQGRRVATSSYCSTYCRDCVRSLAALHPSPLASSDFIAKRALLTDRLLDLWRHGQGPDPALVLQAAETASSGLAIGGMKPAGG